MTNQDCRFRMGTDGKWYTRFPLEKDVLLCIGMPIPNAKLKDATITPDNGRYAVSFKFEVPRELPK